MEHTEACGRDRERGDIVLGWLSRIAVVLTLIGVALFDSISVGVTSVQAQDSASQAAQAGVDAWQNHHNAAEAYQAAVAKAAESGRTLVAKDFSITAGGATHVVVRGEATTLVLWRIGPLKKYVTRTGVGDAAPVAG